MLQSKVSVFTLKLMSLKVNILERFKTEYFAVACVDN